MIYTKVLNFIKNATNKKTFYNDIRSILWDCPDWQYPEDWQIKDLQRKADAKYQTL